ncbi:helix-turn-helix transcriptional regulator [Pedobacter sp.]|jgi:transcriptional regulator with XRE-family HTH domain|uniref:helix-turn-helix domain-containing protein n=1 Tax=Pedobacter sp. TaxID=1411316 RepID=UPI002C1F89E1|nr:helix-turn-helix transcriptional regulator [Pedobacter sp.]HWW42862.1 helix-turn-helix transcriptional regulator [Pedobacter sp.]
MKDIGIKIKLLRIKEQKRQFHLANALGISIPAYSKIEAGITDINTSRLREIASYFNVDPSYFFEDTDSIKEELKVQKALVNELSMKLIAALEYKTSI